jgi:hypothetical protein
VLFPQFLNTTSIIDSLVNLFSNTNYLDPEGKHQLWTFSSLSFALVKVYYTRYFTSLSNLRQWFSHPLLPSPLKVVARHVSATALSTMLLSMTCEESMFISKADLVFEMRGFCEVHSSVGEVF